MLLERRRILHDWARLAREAARAVRETHPKARVYVAGSVARGEAIAASDLDLIVVLDHQPSPREAAEVIALIWEKLGLPLHHPLEIHVIGPEDLERYRRKGPLIPVDT